MARPQRSSSLALLLSFLLLDHAHGIDTNLIHVRLADGVDRPATGYSPPSSSSYSYPSSPPQPPPPTIATTSTITRPPARPYGPRLLRGLAGEVFSVTEGGYEYKVNMFESITQRKTTENVPVLLGVFERWEVVEREKEGEGEGGGEEGKALSFRMIYTDGATCMANTSVVRNVVVDFLCAAPPRPPAAAATAATTLAAATAATADDATAATAAGNADSPGMRLVDQIVKAREEDRVLREGASAGAVVVVQEDEERQRQQPPAATTTATTTPAETEASSSIPPPASPASPSLPPLKPQEQEEVVDFRLSNAREPSTCRYHLTLHSPVPCAVFKRELASFAAHESMKEEEEEEDGGKGGGGTKKKRRKSKGKKGGRKGGLGPLMGGVGRWMGGMWGKAVRAATNNIGSSNSTITASSSSSSACTCPAPADSAAAAAAAAVVGGKEEEGGKQLEALVKEVGELRSQLSAFLEEMRGGREGGNEGNVGVTTAPTGGEGIVA